MALRLCAEIRELWECAEGLGELWRQRFPCLAAGADDAVVAREQPMREEALAEERKRRLALSITPISVRERRNRGGDDGLSALRCVARGGDAGRVGT